MSVCCPRASSYVVEGRAEEQAVARAGEPKVVPAWHDCRAVEELLHDGVGRRPRRDPEVRVEARERGSCGGPKAHHLGEGEGGVASIWWNLLVLCKCDLSS